MRMAWLTSTDGFVARQTCGDWEKWEVALHVVSDLLIWLAYLSIPLVLVYFVRQRRGLPFSWLFVLFALFILACGTTHLVEAVIFYHPVYHLSGVVKAVTAVVSWMTVLALVPAVPRLLDLTAAVTAAPAAPPARPRRRGYAVAVVGGALAMVGRALLDPVLGDKYPYLIAFLAVIYVAWEAGFAPAVVCTVLTGVGTDILFVAPRGEVFTGSFPDRLALGLFLFSGLGTGVLGEAQRQARERAEAALAAARETAARLALTLEAAKRGEDDLRRSEERYKAFVAQSTEGIWRFELDEPVPTNLPVVEQMAAFHRRGYLAESNDAFARMYGYTWAVELTGARLADFFDAADPRTTAFLAAFVRGGYRLTDAESRERDRHGNPRVFLNTLVGVVEDGRLVRAWGTQRDVTDRKYAEEQLRAGEERFRLATEAVRGLVYDADIAAGRVERSAGLLGLVGVRPEDADAGERWWQERIHPDDLPAALAAGDAECARGAATLQREYRVRHADGRWVWVEDRSRVMYGADGKPRRMVGCTIDVTDRKRHAETLERQVAERTAELVRSNKELEEFAFAASHDLQEPLRKIQTYGARLREKARDQLADDSRDRLDRMMGSAGRMSRLIDDLLAYSRVTTRAKVFAAVDLNTALVEALEDLAARVEQSGGTVEADPLPFVTGDAGQLRQLFQNLVGNALKFTRPGVPPVVRVTAARTAAGWELTVSDNGIGFEDRFAGRIFQVFQRLHGRDEYEGTGVGLAVCKKIVDRHGGTIVAHGRPGEGAVFVVKLPARE